MSMTHCPTCRKSVPKYRLIHGVCHQCADDFFDIKSAKDALALKRSREQNKTLQEPQKCLTPDCDNWSRRPFCALCTFKERRRKTYANTVVKKLKENPPPKPLEPIKQLKIKNVDKYVSPLQAQRIAYFQKTKERRGQELKKRIGDVKKYSFSNGGEYGIESI